MANHQNDFASLIAAVKQLCEAGEAGQGGPHDAGDDGPVSRDNEASSVENDDDAPDPARITEIATPSKQIVSLAESSSSATALAAGQEVAAASGVVLRRCAEAIEGRSEPGGHGDLGGGGDGDDGDDGDEQVALLVKGLADLCRLAPWRESVGSSGVLEAVLDTLLILTSEGPTASRLQALRLVANACADTGANRGKVLSTSGAVKSIIEHLEHEDLRLYALVVLLNLCMDYVPAQVRASEANLSTKLLPLIKVGGDSLLVGHACKILDLLITQDCEVREASPHTSMVLLRYAAAHDLSSDLDNLTSPVETALAYLQHEKFQDAVVAERPGVQFCLMVLAKICHLLDMHASQPLDKDDLKELAVLRFSMAQSLADLSARPGFAAGLSKQMERILMDHLKKSSSHLQACACIMLGNVARTDEASISMVRDLDIHDTLSTLLNTTDDTSLLHAALSFLKNLAVPVHNKSVIAASGVFRALPRLWQRYTVPDIQLAAVSLTRLLLVGSMESTEQFLLARDGSDAIIEPSTTSPEHSDPTKSNLEVITSLFSHTDTEPIKTEIARLEATICRTIFTSPSNSAGSPSLSSAITATPTQQRFHAAKTAFMSTATTSFSAPLAFMVAQDKWPVVRSEGWFILALLARQEDAASLVDAILDRDETMRALQRTLEGVQPLAVDAGSAETQNLAEHDLVPRDATDVGSGVHDEATPRYPPLSSIRATSAQTSTAASTSTSPQLRASPATPAPAPAPAPEPAPPQQQTQIHPQQSRSDCENALVLVADTLQRAKRAEMSADRRAVLEGLLKRGSEYLVRGRVVEQK